ncbi:MAG TPA: hypothetical protein VF278_07950 [Pirellulales bacterium]
MAQVESPPIELTLADLTPVWRDAGLAHPHFSDARHRDRGGWAY